MKTIYLHIGQPKTGTTAIQRFCEANAEELANNGYCFRFMPWHYPGNENRRNAYFLVGPVYDEDGNYSRELRDQRVEEGFSLIKQWFEEFDNVILTDESLWNLLARRKYHQLKKVNNFGKKNQYQTKVVVYVRRQDEWLLSFWKQNVRSGVRLEQWDDFWKNVPDNVNLDYYKHLENIANIVGKENVIVRKYEKESFVGGCIQKDFMDAIGVTPSDDYVISKEYVNTSIQDDFVEIKRILNMLQPADSRKNSDLSRFFEKPAVACSGLDNQNYKKDCLTAEERKTFMEQFAEGNQRIAAEYMGMDGDLFHLQDKGLTKWVPDNETRYEDTVLYFGEILWEQQQVIKEQHRVIEEQKKEVQLLRRQMDKMLVDVAENRRFAHNLAWQVSPFCKFINIFRKIKFKISGKEMPPMM